MLRLETLYQVTTLCVRTKPRAILCLAWAKFNFQAAKLLKNFVSWRKRFACTKDAKRCISSAYRCYSLPKRACVPVAVLDSASRGPKDWLLKSGCHWLAKWMQILQAKPWIPEIDFRSSEECLFSVAVESPRPLAL